MTSSLNVSTWTSIFTLSLITPKIYVSSLPPRRLRESELTFEHPASELSVGRILPETLDGTTAAFLHFSCCCQQDPGFGSSGEKAKRNKTKQNKTKNAPSESWSEFSTRCTKPRAFTKPPPATWGLTVQPLNRKYLAITRPLHIATKAQLISL